MSTIFRQWESQEKRRGEAERILEEIGRKLYTFDENFNIHTQEIYQILCRINSKKYTQKYIMQSNFQKKKSLGLRGNLMHECMYRCV